MKKTLLLLALLLPSVAAGADWLSLGTIPEAHVFLDQSSLQVIHDDAVMARLKLVYNKTQPAQTISQGSPFNSSVNQYYLVCSTQKYQVLELTVFYNNKRVGSFHANPSAKQMDRAQLGTSVMLLMRKVCPKLKPGAAHPQNAS